MKFGLNKFLRIENSKNIEEQISKKSKQPKKNRKKSKQSKNQPKIETIEKNQKKIETIAKFRFEIIFFFNHPNF